MSSRASALGDFEAAGLLYEFDPGPDWFVISPNSPFTLDGIRYARIPGEMFVRPMIELVYDTGGEARMDWRTTVTEPELDRWTRSGQLPIKKKHPLPEEY